MNRTIERAVDWKPGADVEYGDIRYEVAEGIAKLTICRPEVRNAFRPRTLFELQDAFERARNDPTIGVIVLTGEGPEAFCSGGDQRIRGDDGYVGDLGWHRPNVHVDAKRGEVRHDRIVEIRDRHRPPTKQAILVLFAETTKREPNFAELPDVSRRRLID